MAEVLAAAKGAVTAVEVTAVVTVVAVTAVVTAEEMASSRNPVCRLWRPNGNSERVGQCSRF